MDNKTIRIIEASLVSFLIFASALFGFSGILSQRSSKDDYSSWMKSVDDSTSLRDIAMPGSHDTMALYSIADFAGQCQSLSLMDQLNLGIRFLDIRLKEVANKLIAVHGFIDQHASFEYITDTIVSFLNDNPSETIIMSIKEEADASNSDISFEQSLLSYLDDDIYYLGNDIPSNLGQVRGKVILLSRYVHASKGIPAYEGWQDSTSFVLPNDIYIQDTYKIDLIEEKQNEIVKCFDTEGHALKINFLSGYKSRGFPPSYAPSAASEINPWINKEIKKCSDRGIVLYDFVNEENMKNFFEGIL